MIPMRVPVNPEYFQCSAENPSPPAPVDIANCDLVSEKTVSTSGLRLRAKVANSDGVEGTAPCSNRNRSMIPGTVRQFVSPAC
jgi:hypothetical protein